MGEVFLADDTQLERKVALKFLPETLQHEPVARAQFEREAKSGAALDHLYICKIYEFTEIEGRAAIVQEAAAALDAVEAGSSSTSGRWPVSMK